MENFTPQTEKTQVNFTDLASSARIEPGSESRYTLKRAADALAPLPPIDWIVNGLLPAGTLTVLFGDAGSKKTFAAIDLSVCVALGAPWLDMDTVQGPALFLDEEMGDRFLSERIGDTLRGHYGDESTPVYYVSLAGFDLRKPEDVNEIHRLILEIGARLVVLDALMDAIPGADENSVKDVLPALKALKHIADRTGAAVLVIHHANKNGGYRGSSAIKGSVDLMLVAQSKQGDPVITFETEKPRLIQNKTFTARANWADGEFYLSVPDEIADARRFLGKPQTYVIRFLAENGPSTKGEIGNHADICAESSAKNAVHGLVSMGLVSRVDGGGPGQMAEWALTDEGYSVAEREGYYVLPTKE